LDDDTDMIRPLVKICGLSTRDTLDAALACGADMVGFVFFEPSPRHIDLATASALGDLAEGRALKVALTVDADDDRLAAIIDALDPQILQLHGRESVARVHAIKQSFGLPVMKAVAVKTAEDLKAVADYATVADTILFDAPAPRDATRPGGLGKVFDWRLLRDLALPVPFLLSGGLHANNVAEALRVTGAAGVDVSSGVERAPGIKDAIKIRAFVAAARANGEATLAPSRPIPIVSTP